MNVKMRVVDGGIHIKFFTPEGKQLEPRFEKGSVLDPEGFVTHIATDGNRFRMINDSGREISDVKTDGNGKVIICPEKEDKETFEILEMLERGDARLLVPSKIESKRKLSKEEREREILGLPADTVLTEELVDEGLKNTIQRELQLAKEDLRRMVKGENLEFHLRSLRLLLSEEQISNLASDLEAQKVIDIVANGRGMWGKDKGEEYFVGNILDIVLYVALKEVYANAEDPDIKVKPFTLLVGLLSALNDRFLTEESLRRGKEEGVISYLPIAEWSPGLLLLHRLVERLKIFCESDYDRIWREESTTLGARLEDDEIKKISDWISQEGEEFKQTVDGRVQARIGTGEGGIHNSYLVSHLKGFGLRIETGETLARFISWGMKNGKDTEIGEVAYHTGRAVGSVCRSPELISWVETTSLEDNFARGVTSRWEKLQRED